MSLNHSFSKFLRKYQFIFFITGKFIKSSDVFSSGINWKRSIKRSIHPGLFIISFFINAVISQAQSGSNDPSFNPGTGANNLVWTSCVQPDGKIIIGGTFSSFNNTPKNGVARLNSDGSLDASFNTGTGVAGINCTALQPDGKIIIGGGFTSFNGVTRNRIARLNSDGSLDASFNPGVGPNDSPLDVVVQSDGKIIVCGYLTTVNGISQNRIARFNSDGSLDATFNIGTAALGLINCVVLQSDGKILIGGLFISFNGITRNRIARLNTDGSIDATFYPITGANNGVQAISIQPDGKIIIGGDFTSVNGTTRNRIARLNADGSLDATFNSGSGANTSIITTSLQPDGKIIIGGAFDLFNGTTRNRIARLNADGSLDVSFDPGTGTGTTTNHYVWTTSMQADGKIIVGGAFTMYNNTERNRITRILSGINNEPETLPTPVITGNTSFCAGTNTTLSTTAVAGYTYCWQNTSASTTWQNVGTPGFTAGRSFYQSLAFNGNTPYVAYQDEANGNKTSVMKFDGTNWVNVGIPGFSPGGSDYHNLAFIGTTPYVVFRNWIDNKCTVMKFDGTNWVNVGNPGFSAGFAGWTKLAINGGVPYVAFLDGSRNFAATVMKFDGNNWVNVGNPGFSLGQINGISLAFGGNSPYVAYQDAYNGSQKTTVMKFDGSSWVNVGNPQFTPGATRSQSLAFDGNTPYVAFMEDALNFKTSVMKFDGTNWVYVGNPGLSAGSSAHPSLAINNNTPYVAYQDDANFSKTTVMKYNGTAWVAVGSSGISTNFANYQSLVFNGNTPYVAFADEPNNFKTTVMKYEPGCVGTNNSIQINTPGTYTVTVTNASGSATSSPVTVTGGAIPAVSCPANLEVCSNTPVFALTGGSPAGGVYSGPGVSNNQFNASSAGTGLKTITYTYTDPSTGCSNSCSFTINIKASPIVNCNVGTMYVCLNQFPFILSNVTPAGGTFSGTGVSNGMFNATVAGVGNHTVTYTVTDPSTGCSSSCSFTVNVKPLPVVNCNVGTMYVCQNQAPFALSNVSPAGGTFSGIGVNNGMFNAAVAGVGSHTITYSYTDQSTSCDNSCSFTVIVRPLPIVNCNNANMSVCLNQGSFALSNVSPAGGTYSGTGVTNGMFNPATAGIGAHTITYTFTDQTTGCSNSCSFTITVNSSAAPVITPVSNNIILNLDASGSRTITLADIATVTSSCNSSSSVRFSPNSFTCSSIGAQTVTVEATDGIFGTPNPGAALFNEPIDVATDPSGNIFVADRENNKIRRISPSGFVTTFVTGSTALRIGNLATDANGNIYTTDFYNRKIHKITPGGIVSTYAGNGIAAIIDGPAANASFKTPGQITTDNQGNVYVSDENMIRKISTTGMVSFVAGTEAPGFADGTGASAKFWGMAGLACDAMGDIYVADGANYRIRKVTPSGAVTTLAGSANNGYLDGPASTARFGYLHGIVLDNNNAIYVADGDSRRIRKLSGGIVSTIAGNGNTTSTDGNITTASFDLMTGITLNANGNLIVCEVYTHKIRKADLSGNVTTIAGNGIAGSTNGNISGITGNYSSLQIPVTIKDATAPVITPVSNNITIPLNANGTKTITLADVATVTDNCNNSPALRISPSIFDCSSVGTQTVTVEATDGVFGTPTPGAALFNEPVDVATDPSGNIFVADRVNNRIRKISPAGFVTTFISGNSALRIESIACDANGNIYVTDPINKKVHKVTPAGVASVYAGNGTAAVVDGAAASASFLSLYSITVDAGGNVYVSDGNIIRQISSGGIVSSIAGTQTAGFADGTGTAARFWGPSGLACDASGNIYVADGANYRVRKVTPAGVVTTIAGNSNNGFADGPFSTARFGFLHGIVLDNNGNIYVADGDSRRIRKLAGGIVSTIAGNGNTSSVDGNISTASFDLITGITIAGGSFIVCEIYAHKIRRADLNGNVTTIAGNGTAGTTNGNIGGITGNYTSSQIQVLVKDVTAPVITPASNNIVLNLDATGNKTVTVADIATATDNCNPSPLIRINPTAFNCSNIGIQNITVEATDGSFPTPLNPGASAFAHPYGIVFDRTGNLFIVDENNQRIRKIDISGNTTTVAGNGSYGFADGPAASAMFSFPNGIAVDAAGNIFVGDDQNNRIRKITPAGVVSTFAGNGANGSIDGTGTNAEFTGPSGIAFDNAGNLIVADTYNQKIRKITPAGVVTTIASNILLPFDVAVAPNGDIYVAQYYKVSKISPNGNVTSIAGTDFVLGYQDGPANTALFGILRAIELDANGNIYVTDNNNRRVRKITTAGIVETIASSGYPGGIAFSPTGGLYFTDHENNKIIKLNSDGSTQIIAGAGGGYVNGNVGSAGSGNFSSVQIPVTVRDITPPSVFCPANITTPTTATHPNQTGWATASDNCTIASSIIITYTDNTQGCNINRTWKATDASGNFSTCLQTIAIPQMSVTLGPDMYILYGALGYVGCKTITPVITGGVAPYTYLWTSTQPSVNNVTTSSIFVCNTTEITHTYTVTVTGATGCVATATVVLHFIDISCSNNGNNTKVSVCLRPQGNASNCHNVCVSQSAAPGLVSNGSYYGQCLPGCEVPIQARGTVTESTLIVGGNETPKQIKGKPDVLKVDKQSAFNVRVFNNPTETFFQLVVESNSAEKITMRIIDVAGRTIESKQPVIAGKAITVGGSYTNGVYFAEIIQGGNRKVIKLIKQ